MFDSSIFVKNVGPEIVVRNLSGSLYMGGIHDMVKHLAMYSSSWSST